MHKEMKMERRRSIEEEKQEIIDLSGLSLDCLPNPSINVGLICKLDLSNNNLEVLFPATVYSLMKVDIWVIVCYDFLAIEVRELLGKRKKKGRKTEEERKRLHIYKNRRGKKRLHIYSPWYYKSGLPWAL